MIAVEGDVGLVGLGFSRETLEQLKDVSVIFHSAASVRFDDILRSAIILNTRGTHEVIKLGLTLDKLASFVHISTTYCYPDQSFIDEKVKINWETKRKGEKKRNPLNVNFSDLSGTWRVEASNWDSRACRHGNVGMLNAAFHRFQSQLLHFHEGSGGANLRVVQESASNYNRSAVYCNWFGERTDNGMVWQRTYDFTSM